MPQTARSPEERQSTGVVPVGSTVHFDPSAEPFLDDVANLDDVWDGEMGGRTWQMTASGLTELR